MKTLEEENQKLSSKLKICLQQKEALLQINTFLDQSLVLMQKLDSLHKSYGDDNDTQIEELNHQLKSCNNSVKEWKQKYNLIEYNQKMKKLYKTPGICHSIDAIVFILSFSSASTPSSKRLTWSLDRSAYISKGHRPQSTIWKYFEILSESEDLKEIKCKFCEKEFRYKNLNATKCRTHIVENCEGVPEDVKRQENNWIEYRPQSKVNIWRHFTVIEEDDKTTVECNYCKQVFSGRNATKCRSHLVGKCVNIPETIKETITDQCDIDFVNSSQTATKSKMSNIWKHFDIEEEDGIELSL